MRRFSFVLIVLLHIVILIGSIVPPGSIELMDWFLLTKDKLLHFVSYFVLTCGYLLYFKFHEISTQYKVSFVLSLVFGVLMECLQYLIGDGRIFDLSDILSNSIGSLLATLIFMIILRSPKIK